jgi:hypothetical protein
MSYSLEWDPGLYQAILTNIIRIIHVMAFPVLASFDPFNRPLITVTPIELETCSWQS